MTKQPQRRSIIVDDDDGPWLHSVGTRMAKNGGGIAPQLTIGTVISALAFAGSVVYGAWSLSQNQLEAIKEASNIQIGHVNSVFQDRAKLDDERYNQNQASIAKLEDTLRNDLTHDLISRNEFRQFEERFTKLESQLDETKNNVFQLSAKAAHDPVETKTIDAVVNAIDKRLDTFQTQIVDINRQIAAAIIIIDSNNAKLRPTTPP
jgi:hypothetical protein